MKITRPASKLFFRQFFDTESSTYTYLLADPTTSEAVLIDPVLERTKIYLQVITDLELKLRYILETHVHADHVTAAKEVREATGAKLGIGAAYAISCADVQINDGDEIRFGSYTIRALSTPGHTNGCTSYFVDGMVFTGDAILIRATGRTDFQSGSPATLYESIHQKIFTLSDDTIIYPAHDYNGCTSTTVFEEKLYNPRIGGAKSKEAFVAIMNGLNLKDPLKIDIAVPANMRCGYLSDRR